MEKEHWENVYENKGDQEVSWYEELPSTSLSLIKKHYTSQDTKIIDVGGGNSNLTKELLKSGYQNLSVLDISAKALEKTKEKLGTSAIAVEWIVSDITEFETTKTYNLWHDRAVFHFLTTEEDKSSYLNTIKQSLSHGGIFILATFSKNGPLKCSGLEISQYDKEGLLELFGNDFELLESFEEDHTTPFNTLQNFIYTVWQRK